MARVAGTIVQYKKEGEVVFKNNVFKLSVDTKKWFKAAGIRAIKTMAQTAVGMLTVGAAVSEVNWLNILSVSFVAGIVSILTSVSGIPEVQCEEE